MDVRITVETIFDNGEKRAVRRMRTSLRFPYPVLILGRKKPTPLGKSGVASPLDALAREQRAEPVPPVPHCHAADLLAPLLQQIQNVSKRKRGNKCRASPPDG